MLSQQQQILFSSFSGLYDLYCTWLSIKDAVSSKENSALIETNITGEKAVIEKYDELIADLLVTLIILMY